MNTTTIIVLFAVSALASVLTPPVLPLFVRNPYLNVWLGDARDPPWSHWPIFWTGQNLGLSVMVSEPESGIVYPLLGRPYDSLRGFSAPLNVSEPQYLGSRFDASTTNFSYAIPSPRAGDSATVVLSFISPITPTSTLRQSLPAAYLSVVVDGSFDINIYVDINGMWASGADESEIMWELSRHDTSSQDHAEDPLKSWKLTRQTEQLLSEHEDRAEWGTIHFTAPASVSHQAGDATLLRQFFAQHGTLNNEVDKKFRKIKDGEPAFAFSKSFHLGNASAMPSDSTSQHVLFTLSLAQDPVVQFASARGLTMMRPLWSSYFADADAMVRYHYDDFAASVSLASNYSDQLAQDAYESGSEYYQDIVALSARQVLGATQFSGTPENPILFLKEISSNGNFQTVDVIFPAFPFFLYTNPKWLGYLLEPLLEHMLSGQYPNDYSMHDLGSHFPNATGHPDGKDEYMPVEECGNMLIMGLALANSFRYDTQPAFMRSVEGTTRLGDGHAWPAGIDEYGTDPERVLGGSGAKEAKKWLSRSYRLLKQWTGYLVRESLIPANQLCTDDFAGRLANQTNLALKGIIGIKAMSEIASILDEVEDAKLYSRLADDYIDQWQGFALSRDGTHAKLSYTWYGSWTTIYNLFADSLLCFRVPKASDVPVSANHGIGFWQTLGRKSSRANTEFVPSGIYKMQSNWYHGVLQNYGLPLDSRHLYTKSDWEFFAAAVTSKKTRTEIVYSIAKWVNETTTGEYAVNYLEVQRLMLVDRPLTDLYETETGGWPGPHFKARPVVGGHFAFLALERACGGRAVDHLRFLDEPGVFVEVNITEALANDMPEVGQEGQLALADDL